MRYRIVGLVLVLILAATWIARVVAPAMAQTPTTQPSPHGPDVVILKELVAEYEPVPFDHKSHAKMAEMFDGCVTCHHRPPMTTTRPISGEMRHGQEDASAIPACRSCHEVAGAQADIRMPNLKGAYHRQCLNCHREWETGNNCDVCHKPRGPAGAAKPTPTPGDIVARMHPPIPEPDAKTYRTRYTPADGGNVLFRHKEHTTRYGLKCVHCHAKENCSQCHSNGTTGPRPLKPGRTWEQSHGPCITCHKDDRCASCHYKDGRQAPPPFEHASTGQLFDADHEKLSCGQCHAIPKTTRDVSCGPSVCHSKSQNVTYPAKRPGLVAMTTRPTTLPGTVLLVPRVR